MENCQDYYLQEDLICIRTRMNTHIWALTHVLLVDNPSWLFANQNVWNECVLYWYYQRLQQISRTNSLWWNNYLNIFSSRIYFYNSVFRKVKKTLPEILGRVVAWTALLFLSSCFGPPPGRGWGQGRYPLAQSGTRRGAGSCRSAS